MYIKAKCSLLKSYHIVNHLKYEVVCCEAITL